MHGKREQSVRKNERKNVATYDFMSTSKFKTSGDNLAPSDANTVLGGSTYPK